MHNFKKIICTAVSAALLIGSIAACSKSDKGGDNDDVEDVVASYLDNIINSKVNKNSKLVEGGEDAVGDMDIDSTTSILVALLENAEYEITDSDVSKKKAEVTIDLSTVSIDDILDEIDDDATTDDFIEALEELASDEDSFEAGEFTFELVQEDGEWVISADSTEEFADYLIDLVVDVDPYIHAQAGNNVIDIIDSQLNPTEPSSEPTETDPTVTAEPTDVVVTTQPEPTETETQSTAAPIDVSNISGTSYVAHYDITDMMVENMGISGYQPNGSIIFDMHLILGDDGTFTMYCDGSEFASKFEDFFRTNMLSMMATMYGMSETEIESLLTSSGMSIDQLVEEALAEADYSTLTNQVSGTYTISGDQVILSAVGMGSTAGTISGNQITMDWTDPSLGEMEFVFVEE